MTGGQSATMRTSPWCADPSRCERAGWANQMKPNFKILKEDVKTRARLGVLNTAHGKVLTPSYVIVGTHAKVKRLSSQDILKTKTQIIISNTYHLWDRAKKAKVIPSWVHGQIGRKMPIMTDSGGFQVFSLGFGKKNKVGKILKSDFKEGEKIKREKIRITDRGVYFSVDGKEKFLGPKESIRLQRLIGADIIFAFDECTSPLDDFKYNERAMIRTHKWARQCLEEKRQEYQMLFGIVQGGKYKQLRLKSAKTIGSMPFDGFGIGGSFGKDQMVKVLKWIVPHLPDEKPRHLLGVGTVRDVFNAVESGMDLFDCVIPTREGRHGRIWTDLGAYDVRKSKYINDSKPLAPNCGCPVCKKMSKAQIRSLFKSQGPAKVERGQRLASIHNIYFFNDLMERIRKSIEKNRYLIFKKSFLKSFKG